MSEETGYMTKPHASRQKLSVLQYESLEEPKTTVCGCYGTVSDPTSSGIQGQSKP
jgi:hypothetical protein